MLQLTISKKELDKIATDIAEIKQQLLDMAMQEIKNDIAEIKQLLTV